MSVYAIAQLWIHDPVTYRGYVDRFMEVFKNYRGRVLVADETPVILEGALDGDKVILVSFPNEALFRDWAESPEYLEIAKRPEGRNEVGDHVGEGNRESQRGFEGVTAVLNVLPPGSRMRQLWEVVGMPHYEFLLARNHSQRF